MTTKLQCVHEHLVLSLLRLLNPDQILQIYLLRTECRGALSAYLSFQYSIFQLDMSLGKKSPGCPVKYIVPLFEKPTTGYVHSPSPTICTFSLFPLSISANSIGTTASR